MPNSPGEASPAPAAAAPPATGLEDAPLSSRGTSLLRSAPLGLLALLGPAIIAGVLVSMMAVNVPVHEDWQRVEILQNQVADTLHLGTLYAPQGNDRPVIPRVLLLALNSQSDGDLRAEIFFSFATVMAGALLLFSVLHRTLENRHWTWGSGFLIGLLLFSPLQFSNFLQAAQLGFLLPLACLALGVWTLTSRMHFAMKFVLSLLAAAIGTHSALHGALLWPLFVALAFLRRGKTVSSERLLLGGSLAICGTAVLIPYFSDGNLLLPLATGLRDTDAYLQELTLSWLTLLGSPLARLFHNDPLVPAPWVGALALLIFLAACLQWIFSADRERQDRLVPWLALAAYAVGAAELFILQNPGATPEDALDPRFISITHYLYVGIVVIIAHALLSSRRRFTDPGAHIFRARLAIALAAGCAVLLLPNWIYGIHKMSAWKHARLEGRFALHFIRIQNPTYVQRLASSAKGLRENAEFLDDRKMLEPPLATGPGFGFGAFRPLQDTLGSGARIEEARLHAEGLLELEGFATIHDRNDIADGILVTFRKSVKDPWEVFGKIEMHPANVMRAAFIDGQFGAVTNLSRKDRYAKWTGAVSIDALPDGDVEIAAWAVDAEKMEAWRLVKSFFFNRSTDKPGDDLLARGAVD